MRTEERAWQLRAPDNRATLVRTVEHQFNDEMVVVKKYAEEEKAAKTVKAIDGLTAKRQKRYAAIYDEMRAAKQTAAAQNPAGMTTSGRGRGSAAGGMTMRGRGMGNVMPNEGMPAQEPGRGAGLRRNQDPNQAADPEFENQRQAWSNSNFEDKRDLLKTVHETDLRELEVLDELARSEKAEKTSAAIEALMILRQQRVTRISAQIEREDARQQRLEQRTGTTPGAAGRGGRGTMPGQQQGTMRGGRY